MYQTCNASRKASLFLYSHFYFDNLGVSEKRKKEGLSRVEPRKMSYATGMPPIR